MTGSAPPNASALGSPRMGLGIQRLVRGIHHFQREVFGDKRALFRQLAEGQAPLALFITCSDSRIDPGLLTQTEPGDLFILRNAGNIVPPRGSGPSGTAATIEYALVSLGVQDIIVCGHSRCGAIRALLNPPELEGLPEVAAWLSHAGKTRQIIQECYRDVRGKPLLEEALLEVAIEENVLVQLEHLYSHASVAAAIARGELRLHGWYYEIGTGTVHAYDADEDEFVMLGDVRGRPLPPGRRPSRAPAI